MTLIFFAITLVGLITLSSGITGMEFKPGERFSLPGDERGGDLGDAQATDWVDILLTVARVFLGLSVLLMPVYIIYLFFSRRARKDLLLLLTRLAVLTGILLLVSRMPMNEWFAEELNIEPGGGGQNGFIDPAPLAEFTANPPGWLTAAAAIVLALVITAVVAMIMVSRRRKPVDYQPYERLVIEAEEAIRDLYDGKDLRQTIIRCYRDMSRALDEEREIKRDSTMTTQEFEELLLRKGLPPQPIHELTHLFEDVRYGNTAPNPDEEQRAISSLQAIVSALRSAA